MSTIIGNAVTIGGGGAKLNIDYGSTPPSDTSKLWVPLSGKPDAVECSPVTQFGDNTIEKLGAVVPVNQQEACAIAVYDDYLYVAGGCPNASSISGVTNIITKVSLKTGSSQILSVTLPEERAGAFYATVNGKLYILGGFSKASSASSSTVYIFDLSTETVSLGTPLTTTVRRTNDRSNSCAVVKGKIYIMGFLSGQSSSVGDIIAYDTVAGSTINTGKNVSARASACAAVNNTVYMFGGTSWNYDNVQKYFKYDTVANAITELGGYAFNLNAAAAIGKYVYIFQGFYGSLQNVVQRYDTETGAFENLSITTTNKCAYRQAITNGFDIYVCAGNTTALNNPYNTVEKFSVNSPLTKNHLFLQADFGYDGLWSALKSKDTDLKVKVINAYLGDSNNIAQLTNAYLYDTASSQWKSLSGESYVADMQNALNILGVT